MQSGFFSCSGADWSRSRRFGRHGRVVARIGSERKTVERGAKGESTPQPLDAKVWENGPKLLQ